jgi:hypothetical protein
MANTTDTREKSYTATVEVHQVTSAGLVGNTSYANDSKLVSRESTEVSRFTVRAATPLLLQDKLLALIGVGIF